MEFITKGGQSIDVVFSSVTIYVEGQDDTDWQTTDCDMSLTVTVVGETFRQPTV